MKNRVLIVLLMVSPWLAAQDHSEMDHADMQHSDMDQSPMQHGEEMDHSQHQMPNDSAPMQHGEEMDHSQHQMPDGHTSTHQGSQDLQLDMDYPLPYGEGGAGSHSTMEHGENPLLVMMKFEEFEFEESSDGTPFAWDGYAWAGYNLNKIYLKSDGEVHKGELEKGKIELLYSRAVAPFWDAQIGLRHDLEPNPSRTWLAAGFMGVAPYHFETDATLYVGEDSRTALEVTTHYEFLFTQKLILAPELALTAYGKDDLQRGLGSGLSDTELGLRLRYEIRREFAPYIGVHWAKKYGETADMARQDGEKVSSTKLIAGLRFWY